MKPPDKTMMHGSDYDGQHPKAWAYTEKFDGFFARWTGTRLLTREGANYNPPDWFIAGLPDWPIDCELFAGYGNRGSLNGAPRWRDKNRWAGLRLIAFDCPEAGGDWPARIRSVPVTSYAGAVAFTVCKGKRDLNGKLRAVLDRGGEGLMLRHPSAPYTVGRVNTLLKVKPGFIK